MNYPPGPTFIPSSLPATAGIMPNFSVSFWVRTTPPNPSGNSNDVQALMSIGTGEQNNPPYHWQNGAILTHNESGIIASTSWCGYYADTDDDGNGYTVLGVYDIFTGDTIRVYCGYQDDYNNYYEDYLEVIVE